ncbi:hypothetical protein [Fundidesulfovibrio terrae]|uniref:hypothetical protein n=1 Tax=Fundidesulfovibrio terrae TaxID=2922866 RepID=UPI001FAF53BD|nr:hypothetical protein [Fundidesulfovibrio terrae]
MQQDPKELVRSILREHPTLSRMEIQAKAFITSKELDDLLEELKAEGLISLEGGRNPDFGGTVSATFKGLKSL